MNSIIETNRLYFRKLTNEDFEDLREMLQDADVMTAWEHIFSELQVQEWLNRQFERYEKDGVGVFAMIEKDTGVMVGQGGLVWSEINGARVLEITYMLKKEYWHKGFAIEGARGLTDYAFKEMDIDKVYIPIRPENSASRKVAEKLGAKVNGEYVKNYNNKDMLHLIYVLDKPWM